MDLFPRQNFHRVLLPKNTILEEKAVELCKVEKQHRILEVGFGLGIGVKAAAFIIGKGHGKTYGIDLSCEMMREACKLLENEVIRGKVELVLGDAADLPYQDDIMDRIFHCNCYYFWPNIDQVCKDLHRVLKPGGFMITTLDLERIKQSENRGYTRYGNTDPEHFMDALKRIGFINVGMKHKQYDESNTRTFQSIFAQKME